MNRGQRKTHVLLWLLLGPLLLVGAVLLLANRPPAAAPTTPTYPGAITP